MAEELKNITLELDVKQKGQIKVHTQILNDLSSGIYSTPAMCIKELVNNSYDAEAKKVTIRVKPVQDSITIIDNGNGMNAEDFDRDFAWISKSNKRKGGELSKKLKRPLIGKIGIGFIAVNEICDELELSSSKKDEAFKFTANVKFKDYFKNAEENKISVENNKSEHKGIIKAEYTLVNEKEEKKEHYTVIRLLGLKYGVKKLFKDRTYTAKKLKERKKYYGKSDFNSMRDLLEYHYDKKLKSFSDDNEYVKFILDLSSYIPVEYVEDGPITGVDDTIINTIVERHKELDFKVDLDGIYLKKPVYFPKQKYIATDFISFTGIIEVEQDPYDDEPQKENILEYEGYFYVQNKILYPRELNGVALRIRGIPIAAHYGYDYTFMYYPNYVNQLFRNWISGEIYIKKGLESAMNIDRASFRVTHPHYLTLQEELHRILDNKVFPLTWTLYEHGKDSRDKYKEKEKKETSRKILNTQKITVIAKPKSQIKAKIVDTVSAKEIIIAPIQIVESSAKSSIIEIDEAISRKFKKKDWEYLEEVFLIFEYAFTKSNGDAIKLREIFYEKIAEWKDIE